MKAKFVAARAEPGDDPDSDIGQVGMATKRLAREHVRDVYFNKGNGDAKEGIAQGNACMGEGTWVDQNGSSAILGCMNVLYEFVFSIALEDVNPVACGRGKRLKSCIDVLKRIKAIDFRLPRSEQVEVGSVHYQKLRHLRLCL